MKEPTTQEWIHFFKLKSVEWLESQLTEFSITVEPELLPFVRAIAHEAFKAGMDFSASNTTMLATGDDRKLLKEVAEYQKRPIPILATIYKSKVQ